MTTTIVNYNIVHHYNNIMNDVLMCVYGDLITQRLQYNFYSVLHGSYRNT